MFALLRQDQSQSTSRAFTASQLALASAFIWYRALIMHFAPLLAALPGFAFACAEVASANRPPRPERNAAAEEAFHKRLDAANERIEAKDYAAAARLLDDALDAPRFRQLPPNVRHSAISVAAFAHFQINDSEKARSLYVHASEMEEATASDWFGRANVARRLHDNAAEVAAVTTVGRRWPEALREANAHAIGQTTVAAEYGPPQARLELLEALFNARWTLFGREPSWVWKDLALLLLQRNDMDGAALVAGRVTSPYGAIAMRVDRRFDRLLEGAGPLDVHRMQDAEIEQLRTAAGEAPPSLKRVHNLLRALAGAGRYGEIVQRADFALAHAGPGGSSAYEDADEARMWILNDRASAMERLGRWEDAVADLEDASRMAGHQGGNVNQTINLATLYVRLDRPADALATIARVPLENTTAYGRFLVEGVRHACAIAQGNAQEAAATFTYLRDHRDDAPDAYQAALLDEGLDDQSEATLVSLLRDSQRRNGALMSVQQFARGAEAPRQTRLRERWRAVVERHEVQAVIAEVGRAERWDIPPEGG